MAAENTPGRLLAATHAAQSQLRDEAGNLVAVITPYQPKAALRLAACWNACEGVPMDWLDSWANPEIREMFGSFDPLHIVLRKWIEKAMEHSQRAAAAVDQRDHFAQLAKDNGAVIIRTACDLGAVTAQRDELLAVLEQLAPAQPMNQDEMGGCVWCGGTPPGDRYGNAGSDQTHHDADCPWLKARALLAKHQPPAGTAPA